MMNIGNKRGGLLESAEKSNFEFEDDVLSSIDNKYINDEESQKWDLHDLISTCKQLELDFPMLFQEEQEDDEQAT